MIFVDSREPEDIVTMLKNYTQDIEVRTLEVGDFLIGDWLIERKTVQDFLSSLGTERMAFQLESLRAVPCLKKIAIVGTLPPKDLASTRLEYKMVMGAVASIETKGVPVSFYPSTDDFILYLVSLSNHTKKTDSSILAKLYRHHLSIKDIPIRTLCSIPGIGPALAQELLKGRTIRDVCNMTKEDLLQVPGIGEKKAEKILEVLKGES